MNQRADFVADLATHLGNEVAAVMVRHGRLAQAAGASGGEVAALMLLTTEAVARQALGILCAAATRDRRSSLYADAVSRLACGMHNDQDRVLRALDNLERTT